MNERRITQQSLDKHDPRSRLKNVAGLLENLSYKEMKELGDLFDATNAPNRNTAERLLVVAEKILKS